MHSAETMKNRPATLEEIKAKYPEGSRVSFRHATYETARLVRGAWVDVQRSKSTATIHYDEQGAYVMRKGQRESLKATFTTYEGVARPIIWDLRGDYLA